MARASICGLILGLICLHEVAILMVDAQGIAPSPAPVPINASSPAPGPVNASTPAPAPAPAPANASNPGILAKIDTHTHYIPPFYRDLLAASNLTSGGFAIPPWNVSTHLAVNALLNIETAVISVSNPGAKLSKDEPVETGRTLARELNEYGRNLTVEYPKKFLLFATLTLPDLEGSVAEAIYALDTLGAAGVILQANAFGELLGTRRYDPLYKVLNDRNAVVFIHPSISPCPEAGPGSPPPALPPYIVDFLLDTTRAAVELVYTNVTTDYPNITFILAHSGGFLPFAAMRAADALGIYSGAPAKGPEFLDELSQFNADLAISLARTALPSTLSFFNSSRLTFGTDFPYNSAIGATASAVSVQDPPVRISRRLIRMLAYGNGFELFKRFLA